MSIQSLCKTNVATADANTPLRGITDLMQKRHVGSVVITETSNGKISPTGIVTDRDIALSLGSVKDIQNLAVKKIMLGNPLTANKLDGIYEVIFKMREHGVKRLPVVNDDGSLYGIISTDDLFELMAEEISNLAKINGSQVKKERGYILRAQVKSSHNCSIEPYMVYS